MELIQAQQAILARNGENQRKRQEARDIEAARDNAKQEKSNALARVEELNRQIVAAMAAANEADRKLDALETDLAAARKTAAELADESTAEIEASLSEIELTNAKVRDNQRRAEAQREADELDEQYRETTARIEELREAKMSLLEGADLPLAGLAVDNGLLSYEGRRWDCMSGSEQLRVATAIVRKLKPECGFVLVDKLEQMDPETLREFGAWAEAEGLQVIATRVSTGGECSIVIEDGYGGASQGELVNLGVPYARNQAVLDAGVVEPAAPAKWVM